MRELSRVPSTDTCNSESGSEKLSWYFTLLGWWYLPACKGHRPLSLYTDLMSLTSFRRHLPCCLWLFFHVIIKSKEQRTIQDSWKISDSPLVTQLTQFQSWPAWPVTVNSTDVQFLFPSGLSCQEALHIWVCTVCIFTWSSISVYSKSTSQPKDLMYASSYII